MKIKQNKKKKEKNFEKSTRVKLVLTHSFLPIGDVQHLVGDNILEICNEIYICVVIQLYIAVATLLCVIYTFALISIRCSTTLLNQNSG